MKTIFNSLCNIFIFTLAICSISFSFNFAVFSDVHMGNDQCELNRLEYALNYLQEHNSELDLKFIMILGDLGNNEAGEISVLNKIGTKIFLDKFSIPIFPMCGDNEYVEGIYNTYYSGINSYRLLDKRLATAPAPSIKANFAYKLGAEFKESIVYYGQNSPTTPRLYFRFLIDNIMFIGLDLCHNAEDPTIGNVPLWLTQHR